MFKISLLKMDCNILSCQRYNYYIQKGIDLENVAPLMDSWLENIQDMVPCHLKSLSTPMELLVDEIKEDYLLSVKTAICMSLHLTFYELVVLYYYITVLPQQYLGTG